MKVAAPVSTIDLKTKEGKGIPIEYRHPEEVILFKGNRIAPEDVSVYNPAFDVTPAELIDGIITDYGIVTPVNGENMVRLFAY